MQTPATLYVNMQSWHKEDGWTDRLDRKRLRTDCL